MTQERLTPGTHARGGAGVPGPGGILKARMASEGKMGPRSMDRGAISEQDTCEVFGAFRIPGFRFERWLAEMVEEGVYVETAHLQAA